MVAVPENLGLLALPRHPDGVTSRRVEVHRTHGPGPTLWHWSEHRSVVRTSLNWVFMALARVSPSFQLKNGLYRMMRCRVGERVAVGLEATVDVMYPELIEIGDDVTVGYSTTILCHEYVFGEYRTGAVVIGPRATIGANCTILPGVRIGADAIVSAMSLVNRDIPDGEFWGGVPVRRLRPADAARQGSQERQGG